MNLAIYVAGRSPLHRVPAPIKLIALAAAGTAVIAVGDPWALAGGLAFTLALFAAARLPARDVVRQAKPMLLLAGLIAGAHALFGHPELGLLVALRFAILVLLATLVAMTTQVSAMLETFERALAPLAPLGVSPARIGLLMALAIRLVPLVFAVAGEVREAQRARGLDRNPVALLTPLIIRLLRIANDLGEAIEARGFEG